MLPVKGLKFVLALLLVSLAAPSIAVSATPVKSADVTKAPIVTLKNWKDANDHERYSFLLGFITAIELEKEWQGKQPLPFSRSLNSSWVKGLSGVPLATLNKRLLDYIEQNPDKLERPVVEVAWFEYVQPVLDKDAQERVTSRLKNKK